MRFRSSSSRIFIQATTEKLDLAMSEWRQLKQQNRPLTDWTFKSAPQMPEMKKSF